MISEELENAINPGLGNAFNMKERAREAEDKTETKEATRQPRLAAQTKAAVFDVRLLFWEEVES